MKQVFCVLGGLVLVSVFSLESLAFIEPNYESLRDAKIQCDVTEAFQSKDGRIIKRVKPNSAMTTMTQDGGEHFVDAKCFISPALDLQGAESTISFGCIPLDERHVKVQTARKIKIVRKEYGEVVEIDFQTGKGRHSFKVRACDWGDCTMMAAVVDFSNCSLL